MNINSMISVKVAAAMLGRDKKYVREKLDQGLYKGELRLDGDKEKWFVQKKDVEAELAKMPIVTPDGTYHLEAQGVTVVENEPASPQTTPTRRRRKSVEKPKTTDNNMFFGVEPVDVQSIETVEDEVASGASATVIDQVVENAVESIVGSALDGAAVDMAGAQVETSYIEEVYEDTDEFSFSGATFNASPSAETDYYQPAIEEVIREALREKAIATAIAEAKDAPSMLTMVQVMAREFAKRIEDHRQLNARLVEELEERNMRLRLLPDLQKRADEVYRLEFEAAALRLQISCMEQQQFDTIVALERAEQEAIPQLQSMLEEEYRMHSIEVARLREQVNDLAHRARFDEQNRATIVELETALYEMIDSKEREKRIAQAEIEKVRMEREAEIQRLAEETIRLKKEKDQELAQIAQFTAQYQRQKEFEIALLNDEADLITQEKKIIESRLNERLAQLAVQAQRVEQLEEQLRDAAVCNEIQKLAAQEEAERIATEMGNEVNALNERLTKLTEQLTVSRMPWWKKLFMPTA
jgi:hypothetical protein